ncbi:hypothetical protein Clacol_007708 [Clathrus columnatus]|uniref:NAD(P)-binding protein n=1 Tax=Clathrus columnatus TaxID=1419009 RepID=A0AAV5AFN4_9AGAM|nr:hypothetical protein Clacol_007708 [Clathrus columnatus]
MADQYQVGDRVEYRPIGGENDNVSTSTGEIVEITEANFVVVVTGGGTGIGLMTAQAFANNGARVYIVGRRQEALDQAIKAHGQNLLNGGKFIPIVGDTSHKEGAIKIAQEIASKEKHVNVLINNAGVATKARIDVSKAEDPTSFSEELLRSDENEWSSIYAVNVVGYYLMTAAFLPLLSAATKAVKGYSGCVINIASISGTTYLSQGQPAYNVSKAAVTHLTHIMAGELSRPSFKVRVNAISPGIFPSEMTTKDSGEDQKSHIPAEGFGEKKGVPAGRPGKDDDIAQAVLLLATNTYINGQNGSLHKQQFTPILFADDYGLGWAQIFNGRSGDNILFYRKRKKF